MNIFKIIRKAWLQYRVDRYTLKSQDLFSKSKHFLDISKRTSVLSDKLLCFGSATYKCDIQKLNTEATEYNIKSDEYAHRAQMYEKKKLNL